MFRPTAVLIDSAAATESAVELSFATPATPTFGTLRRFAARAQDACQIAFLFLYLVAAMTPQVRRALMVLDRG